MNDFRLSFKLFLSVGSLLAVVIVAVIWLVGSRETRLQEKAFDDSLTSMAVVSQSMFHAAAEEYCRSHGMSYHRVRVGQAGAGPTGAFERDALAAFAADPGLALRKGEFKGDDGATLKYTLVPARLRDECITCHASVGMDALKAYKTGDLVATFGISLSTAELERSVRRTRLVSALAGLGLLAVVSWIVTLSVKRQVLIPLTSLSTTFGKMAGGDLTVRAAVASRDELGQLAEAFNDMAGKLNQALQEVSLASQQVASGSMELAASAEEMTRTVDQVAEVGERLRDAGQGVQEALKKLDGNVEAMAEQARRTTTEADSAVLDTGRGAQEGRGTTEGMQAIQQATTRIVTAVQAIQGIARQTNLLSLNAAIEAAKAGQQGKGFAVVAEEVRKLAERSAQSAREIEGIIRITEEAVASGDASVRTTLVHLETIGKRIGEIAARIREIGGLSQEQARTSTSVGHLMGRTAEQLDHNAAATQQLNTAVQEVARTSEDLAHVAEGLKDIVGRFKL